MPTGYTANIKNGISFKEYATTCMRQFGATIMMRDEPWDTPITKEKICGHFDKSFYETELEKVKERYEQFKNSTKEELKQQFKQEKSDNIKRLKQQLKENKKTIDSYKKMLAKVKKFVPPTDEHINYKNFMISQIEESMSFDDSEEYLTNSIKEYTEKTFETYLKEIEKDLLYKLQRYSDELNKDIMRNDSRWEWVEQALKAIEKVR